MKETKHSSFAGIMEFAGECKSTMILSVVLAIISVLCGLSPYFAVSGIIVDFIEQRAELSSVLFWLAIFIAGTAIKSIMYANSTLLSHRAAFNILKNIRKKITEKLRKVPMGFLQDLPSGKLKMLIVDEVEKLEYPLAHAIPELTSNIVAPAAIFIFILFTDVRMAFISLITLPLGFLITGVMIAGYKKRYNKWFESGETMNNTIVEYINGIEVIKAFNQTTSSFEKYSNAVIRYRDYTLAWYKANWPFNAAYAAVLPAVLVATLPFGAKFYLEGSIDLATLLLTLILSLGFIPPIMKLIEFTDNLTVISQTETRIHDMLSAEEMSYPEKDVSLKNLDLKLSDVSFTYSEKPVLKKISLEMKENTTTALVGASGSGKSTITRLIARFWDVNEGEITIGGRCIKDIPQAQLSSLISAVSQNIYLFNMSIMENIRVGSPDASEEEIKRAAALAGCDDFISRFTEGYETTVGDAGDRLSGGEKQRIAIARAILKDSPIILLDEATASIDAENEYRIQQSINSLTKNKTLVILAHRLSTIVHADKIVVIDNGEIRAQGRHEELLESSRLYRSMWEAHLDAGKWSIGTTVAGYKNV